MTDTVRDVGVSSRAMAGQDMVGSPFDLATTCSGHDTVVKISGDLVFSTTPRLREELVSLATRGMSRITLDLVDVAFIDSTGLGVLVSALKRCRVMGGDVVLRSPNATIRKILDVTGLTTVFAITRDNTSVTDAGLTAALECPQAAEPRRRLGFGHRRR